MSTEATGSPEIKPDETRREPLPTTNDERDGAKDNECSKADSQEMPLPPFEWETLEAEYTAQMQTFANEESKAFAEFDHWLKVFEAWVVATTAHENERAAKRLRTRIAHVQLSEERLESKRQHYVKVVEAFRGALQMLE